MNNKTIYVLTPDEGQMLFNAEKNLYSDYVMTADIDHNWVDVPMEQYEDWLKENYNNQTHDIL